MNKKELIKLISTLDEKELKNIKNKIDFFLRNSDSTVDENIIDQKLFYAFLIDTCFKKIGGKHLPYSIVIKSKLIKKKLEEVTKFLNTFLQNNSNKKNKRSKIKLYTFFAGSMIQYIQNEINRGNINANFSLLYLLNNYNKFTTIIECEFPGYLESGLLNYILENKKGV